MVTLALCTHPVLLLTLSLSLHFLSTYLLPIQTSCGRTLLVVTLSLYLYVLLFAAPSPYSLTRSRGVEEQDCDVLTPYRVVSRGECPRATLVTGSSIQLPLHFLVLFRSHYSIPVIPQQSMLAICTTSSCGFPSAPPYPLPHSRQSTAYSFLLLNARRSHCWIRQ